MSAAREMIQAQSALEGQGHTVIMPGSVEDHADTNIFIDNKEEKIEHDYIRKYYTKIKESDIALVINTEKKGVAGYIGGNTLIEIAFAYVHNKPIYLLNTIPEVSYRDEIEALQPTVINKDLSKIILKEIYKA